MKEINRPKIKNNTFQIPKPILNTGKFLQSFSKSLTVKFLARIFETPPKFKTPKREKMMRESAKNELLFVPEIQKNIMVYSYGFSKKKVLLLHGWSGRGTQLHHIADKLLENKMMVISPDAPAHGLSEGKTTNMLEYMQTLSAIEKKFGPFDFAIGHSWGGMTLLNSVANKLNLKKIVIIGADDTISGVLKSFVKKMELKPQFVSNMMKYYHKKFKFNIDDFSSNIAAKKVMIPTLVIHDSQDKFVPVSSAIIIRQNLKNGELLITNGLGHHKIFKDKKIINRIIKFLEQ